MKKQMERFDWQGAKQSKLLLKIKSCERGAF